MRVIKSFVRGDYEENKFAKTNEDLKNATIHAVKIILLVTPVMTLAMNVGTIAIVWFGGKGIMAGTIPVGDVMAFITYVTQILMALGMLAMVFMQSAKAVASLNRINEVMNATVDLTDEHAKFKEKTVQEGRIEFRNVSFQYYKNSEKKVLDNISFTILPGEVVGIIGPTGCGKTTLVQMIPRLYDVDAGEVLVDGINVKDYSLQHLRDAVGMVLQKNVLFSGTIIENLKWGNEDATQAEIKKCAKAAQADGFIQNFAKQYETELGQGGVNLSGGQKQRICIARTLLKNPKILILDDSTSAVDTTTEAKILQALRENFQDITKIIIAQRISSVMAADKIIVMDNGQIAGIGTHTELLQSCKTYREIYNSQTSVGEVIA
ncbi:MAG: ABC transporter ATP-binding protein [Clostridium sp.]